MVEFALASHLPHLFPPLPFACRLPKYHLSPRIIFLGSFRRGCNNRPLLPLDINRPHVVSIIGFRYFPDVPSFAGPVGRVPLPWSVFRTGHGRSEEHTSELQSLMRISYAVFCLKKKNINKEETPNYTTQFQPEYKP